MNWKLDKHKHNITGTGWHIRDKDGCTVAIAVGTPEGEMKPIADLIVAAPDLLEALELLIDDLALRARLRRDKCLDVSDGRLYKAQKAIAKARGEE